MRILAIAQILHLAEEEALIIRKRMVAGGAVQLKAKPVVDGVVVGAGETKDLERQPFAGRKRGGSVVCAELLKNAAVAGGVGHHGDRGMVLGC